MEAFGYTRVSTDRQAQEGVSLEVQSRRIGDMCDMRGWTLQHVHTDSGLSAREMVHRPELNRAIDTVCAKSGVLVVYDHSRMCRNVADGWAILHRLNAAGACLASVLDPIDTTTAIGKMLFSIKLSVDQYASDLTGEKTAAAIQHLRQTKGFNPTGKQPYGWQIVGGTAQQVHEEQLVIDKARNHRKQGLSLRQIAHLLELDEIPGPTGNGWNHQSVSRILDADNKPRQ